LFHWTYQPNHQHIHVLTASADGTVSAAANVATATVAFIAVQMAEGTSTKPETAIETDTALGTAFALTASLTVFTARRYASTVHGVVVWCLSVQIEFG